MTILRSSCSLLGALGLGGLFACNQSVEGLLGEECRRGGVERDPQGNRAEHVHLLGQAGERGRQRSRRRAQARRPRSTPEGHFLRYSDDMVGIVTPEGEGSKAYLADERNGYGFFLPFVGGFWGTYRAAAAESFRGGGPAAGK